MALFGGFSPAFFDAYHKVLPRGPGFETRQRVYTLYHYLNQLNLFGDPVLRDSCVQLMKEIVQEGGGVDMEVGGDK